MGFDERKESAHNKMVRLVGKNKKVLEVGSGGGAVTERLKQNGCSVTCIEIDSKMAEQAKKHAEKVLVGNVEELRLPFAAKSFDVLLFGDVLEHLRNPKATLEKLKPFLKDNGFIAVSLPNVANWKIRLNLLLGKFEYTDWGILDKTHLHFFTRKTAAGLLQESGFEILEKDFSPSIPFPFFKSQLAKLNRSLFSTQFLFRARKKG